MKRSLTLSRIVLIIFSVLIVAAPACKKKKGDDDPVGEGTISFKANGVQKIFDVAGFNTHQEGGFYVCFLNGGTESSGVSFVSLKITSSQPVAKKNYVNDTGDGRDIEFRDTDSKSYSDNDDPYTTITVDKISENNIQGTFSGTLYGADAATVTITDGKFNCRRLM